MKRKIYIISAVLLCCFFMSGCTANRTSALQTNDYLISALGFEQTKGEITAYAEAVVINTEDNNAEKKLELLIGKGKNLEKAMESLYNQALQGLEFSHCAAIVIGNGIEGKTFLEIKNFFLNKEKLNLSIQYFYCDNPKELFRLEPLTSVAIGYDIISCLQTKRYVTGQRYNNRFYEIESERKKPLDITILPELVIEDDAFLTEGLVIFKKGSKALKLNKENTQLYAIASDDQGRGSGILFGKRQNIKTSVATVKISGKNPQNITLTVNIKGETLDKKKIQKGITELFEYSKNAEVDIFGFGNMLAHRKPVLWERIEESYYDYYKNIRLKVRVV